MQKVAMLESVTLFELRTIAAFLFMFLSGMRISAFLSLPIKAFDSEKKIVLQNPTEGTYTKLNKFITTKLLDNPIMMKRVLEWDAIVREKCPDNSTWYARMTSAGNFDPKIIDCINRQDPKTYKQARSSYKSLMRSWKKICQRAGIRYLSPHKERYGNIHEWMPFATTLEQIQALADNNGHSVHTLQRTYSRLEQNQSVSVMNKMIEKKKNPTAAPLNQKSEVPGLPFSPEISDNLPEAAKEAIMLILKGSGVIK